MEFRFINVRLTFRLLWPCGHFQFLCFVSSSGNFPSGTCLFCVVFNSAYLGNFMPQGACVSANDQACFGSVPRTLWWEVMEHTDPLVSAMWNRMMKVMGHNNQLVSAVCTVNFVSCCQFYDWVYFSTCLLIWELACNDTCHFCFWGCSVWVVKNCSGGQKRKRKNKFVLGTFDTFVKKWENYFRT